MARYATKQKATRAHHNGEHPPTLPTGSGDDPQGQAAGALAAIPTAVQRGAAKREHRGPRIGERLNPDAIVKANEGLARMFAEQFGGPGRDTDELVQWGRIAIWKASLRYNSSLGVRFSTYAGRAIRNTIIRELKLRRYGGKRNGIQFIPICESHAGNIPDFRRVNGNSLETKELHAKAMSALDQQERFICNAYFSGDMNYRQIAEVMGHHFQRIEQIKRGAMEKARAALGVHGIV